MTSNHSLLRYAIAYLCVKSIVFLTLAVFSLTPIPPLLLGGLTLTWLALAVLLTWVKRRLARLGEPIRPNQPASSPARSAA
jgi:hypothetical protein